MTVLILDIKYLLDAAATNAIPDETINENILRSDYFIEQVADSTATNEQKDHASRAMAVWLTYGSYTEGISQQLGNIGLAEKVKLDHFRNVAELFINQISQTPVDLNIENRQNVSEGIPITVFTLTNSDAHGN